MGRAGDWAGGWVKAGRRIAAAPYAPAVAGALLGLSAVAELIARGGNETTGNRQLAVLLLGLATTLPLGLLWGQPAAAAVAVSAASVLSLAAFHTLTVAGLVTQLIVLYRLGRCGSPVLAVGLALPFIPLAVLSRSWPVTAQVLIVLLACLAQIAAWAGIAWRARGEAVAHSAAHQVIADTLVEHTARGERARITRELHDVVAHHISMVAVQAETARLTTPGMPAAGAERLSSIGNTARDALTEMRRLLGVLREDAQEDAADRRPQPGLRELNELLDESRDASGTAIRLIVWGRPAALDPGVELAAYRIVQEALTNSRRHAPGAAVDVELHYAGDALRLRIRDNGPGPPPPARQAGGHGLLGMRERAAAVGGELRTGPAFGGGFLVDASLPGRGALAEASLPGRGADLPATAEGQPAGRAGLAGAEAVG